MSTTNYRRYVEQTLALAKSLTIKSEASVIGINQYVEALGHPLSDDPATWKYYQNLAGIYHPLDQPMSVVSLDTLETIPFTKEALREHRVTQQNYHPASTYYKDLVNRYPAQELLVRGVVNPVDIATAIAAKDHSILFADTSLIESNETNLLSELQTRLDGFAVRWDNPSYAVVDDLYVTAYLAILYYNIPGWLFNIRLANCKTMYAHSFHIREYLRSNGYLDSYYDYLTKGQALFLYRNILYIERNAGKQDTFDWLKDRLLTERGVGLAEFKLRHKLTTLVDDLRPEAEFVRQRLNPFHRSARVEEHTFHEVLIKERNQAVRNSDVETEVLFEDTPRLQYTTRNNYPTKVLESAIIDWSESGVMVRTVFLMNHWAHWASQNIYQAVIRVNHPRTGTLVELGVRNAFILYLYAYNRSVGVRLTEVPSFVAQGIRRPTPDFATLRNIVDRRYVSDELIRVAISQPFAPKELLSPYSFVETATQLFNEFYTHREIYSLQEHARARGQVQALIDHLYMNVDSPLAPSGMTYQEWLTQQNLDFEDFTDLEFSELAANLLSMCTGVELTGTHSPSDVQQALVRLMAQLSSYSVQFTQEVNLGPILFWDWPAIRVGDAEVQGTDHQRVRMLARLFPRVDAKGIAGMYWDVRDISLKVGITGNDHVKYTVLPGVRTGDQTVDRIRVKLARTRVINVVDVA